MVFGHVYIGGTDAIEEGRKTAGSCMATPSFLLFFDHNLANMLRRFVSVVFYNDKISIP